MIIGHIGAGFAARRLWPRVPLALLLLAAFIPDLVRLGLVLAGANGGESNTYSHVWPWSGCVLAGAAALAWLVTRRRDVTEAVAALIASHVLLDMISGTKLLWPGGPRGINLDDTYWQYELVIEWALAFGGWWLMRPVVSAWWKRRRTVVALLMLELGVQVYGVYQHPFRTRCWIYPFTPCDDETFLSHRMWPLWFAWQRFTRGR